MIYVIIQIIQFIYCYFYHIMLEGETQMKNPFISLDLTSSPELERVKIEKAWEHFVTGKQSQPKVRSLTYQSWERSLKNGVHPTQGRAPVVLSRDSVQEYQATDPLFSFLEPLLQTFGNSMIDNGHLITFCNEAGNLLYIGGNAALKHKAEEMNFIEGTSWSEYNIGTNAMGTSLAIGAPMQVFAGEHFSQPVHNWVCSAAPIKDPSTKKIVGAINLTGIWNGVHPHSLATVVSLAEMIEEKLLNRLKYERFLLLEHYTETIHTSPGKIIAVLDRGHNVIKASPAFYEQRWIDEHSRRLIVANASSPLLLEKKRWKLELAKEGWAFEAVPFYHAGLPIGIVVHAIPKTKRITKKAHPTKYSFSTMIGQSSTFQALVDEARLMANLDLPIFIEGESGTGKELLAQAIHAYSHRSDAPFIAVNCGAISKELALSEFFGYEEGSFTGSIKGGRAGKFQQAEGGTIFLDEIGEMSLELQTILLRVLEEKEIVRIGGMQPITLNVRMIAATNRDLRKACVEGTFRKDLYYRLNILSLHVPPLRERIGDIQLLLKQLLESACNKVGRPLLNLDDEALAILESYEWPGNVRELRNLSYKLALHVRGPVITVRDLPNELRSYHDAPSIMTAPSPSTPLKEQEMKMILSTLKETNGNVTKAAKKLGIHRSTIYRKLNDIYTM